MRNQFNSLTGGTVSRLAKMRRYRDTWNAEAETKTYRTQFAYGLADGLAGCLQARGHGIGKWDTGAHGLRHRDGNGSFSKDEAGRWRDYAAAPLEMVNGWRDVGYADEVYSGRAIDHHGWFTSADGWTGDVYRGHVWQLPARDGVPQYVAGYTEANDSKDSGYVVLCASGCNLELFDDKDDAARAGDALAERMAEQEREYDERWQAASLEADNRDEARDDMRKARQSARAAIAALREQRAAGAVAAGVCAILADRVTDARETMRDALERIVECSERIADLDMMGEF